MNRTVAVLLILLISVFLAKALMALSFGSFEREATEFYLSEGMDRTGSANIVNAIVWDFRSYDTMGEELVLFTAALGVMLVLGRFKDG